MKKIMSLILSSESKQKIIYLIERCDLILVKIFSQCGWLASLYYLLLSNKFRREHRATLLGRLTYFQLNKLGTGTVMLRRNIHRLEKGLIMRPRRDVFASDYILETVSCYANGIKNNTLHDEERFWANDVLDEFFTVVGMGPEIDKARKNYNEIISNYKVKTVSSKRSIPYARSQVNLDTVNYDSLLNLFIQRRSVRWYLDKTVDILLIRKAVNAASLAPSACNRQPFKFYVVNDKTRAKSIADCAMGTVGFSHNLPCIIAIVGDLSCYPAERDRHLIYIDASLANMQLMLALETLGLSSCPINWPDIEQREKMLQSKLNLEYTERPVMLLAVGHADPDALIPYSQKKSDVELVVEK